MHLLYLLWFMKHWPQLCLLARMIWFLSNHHNCHNNCHNNKCQDDDDDNHNSNKNNNTATTTTTTTTTIKTITTKTTTTITTTHSSFTTLFLRFSPDNGSNDLVFLCVIQTPEKGIDFWVKSLGSAESERGKRTNVTIKRVKRAKKGYCHIQIGQTGSMSPGFGL